MNTYTNNIIFLSTHIVTHIIVSILRYKYKYNCMYPCFIIVSSIYKIIIDVI